MYKLQLLNLFLNEKLIAVPLEISVAVKKTIAEHQEEICRLRRANERLRRILDLVFKPEIQLHRLAGHRAHDVYRGGIPNCTVPVKDLQQRTLSEEEVNCGQQHCEQERSASLGLVESDAVESIWDSINIITVENQTDSEDESNRESQSTSDYQPPSDVNPDSDNEKVDGVVSRIPPSGSKRGRGRPRKHTDESPDLKCDVCGKFSATAANLKRHQQNHHSEERPRKETSGLPDLKCDVCGKCFTAARSLMRHRQNRHSDERPYMCDTCGQCFTLNCYLTRHMKRHTEERQHCCTECGKRFFHKENLENHMGVHRGGAFKCDVCGRCLTTKGGLKFHQKKHTEQKSHRCKECSKAFFCRSNLKKHMRIHTGEKPFWCKECGKCFGENGSLSKHMMTHTEEKPHRCNECGRCFGLKGNLTVHMRTHRGEGVQCHLCGTHLKLASSLKRHLRTHRKNIHND